MSREVLTPTMAPDGPGATAGGPLPVITPTDLLGPPDTPRLFDLPRTGGAAGPAGPDAPDVRRRTPGPRAAVVLVAGLVAATLGWAGASAWTNQQAQSARETTGRADAVATGPVVTSPGAGRTTVSWAVVLTNPGQGTVLVHAPRPSEVDAEAPGFLSAWPRDVVLRSGATERMTVVTIVTCGGTDPLVAPRLQVRMPGQDPTTAPVAGALDLATGACASQPGDTRALVVDAVARDGPDLLLTVRSPTGRAWRIQSARAGGVDLVFAATDVAAEATTLRLALPDVGCPDAWSTFGVAQEVSLRIAGDEPTDVVLDVGRPLARWLLEGLCPAGSGAAP